MRNFPFFSVRDYVFFDILITVHVKCLYRNCDNLFMFSITPKITQTDVRTGSKTNEQTLPYPMAMFFNAAF